MYLFYIKFSSLFFSGADRDPCPNGAADWLLKAGICYLVSSILLPCILIGAYCGFSSTRNPDPWVYWPQRIPFIGVVIMELACLIWGSVVVFGAYNDWTYEKPRSENYCEYTPMMLAFVTLIIKWVEEKNIFNYSFSFELRSHSELCSSTITLE